MFIFNLDDFHDIHEKRRPDATFLSTVKHFASCIAKKVEYHPVSAMNEQVSIHNPNNIEAHKIQHYLINKYKGTFDISYQSRKNEWITKDLQIFNSFDNDDLLTIHAYNDAIKGKHEERSMKDVRIIGLQERSLHSLEDYIEAASMITDIPELSEYLLQNVIPVVADFLGQLFIRKAITLLNNQGETNTNIPKIMQNFVPLLGPLHVSLNSREQTLLVHYIFFEKMFHYVFGNSKVLAKKPKPWRINLLLELAIKGWKKISKIIMHKFGNSKDVEYRMALDLLDNIIPATLDIYAILFRSGKFEEYLKTLFRIWTFALRWKRKNYNKIILAFISDYIYWKENQHPFANVLENHLVNFNEYYVENFHSRLCANINVNQNAESIINQAFVIGKFKYIYHIYIIQTLRK